jgi:zinc/manganese transport system substrate-binding protein
MIALIAALHVVTTTETLASLAREITGTRVEVTSLTRGVQDPHYVDARPSLVLAINRADLLVDVGLDLEIGWLPVLVNQARNASVLPGGKGRLTAGEVVQVMDLPTGAVDRSRGDIHPRGNPHIMTDPRRVRAVAAALAARLAELDPQGAGEYRSRQQSFDGRAASAEAAWGQKLASARGREIVTYHRTLTYFLDWAGLRLHGEIEPKPGVPPSAAHLAELITSMRSGGVKAVVSENFMDTGLARMVADKAGARLLVIAGDVGGMPEAKDWFTYMDTLVQRVAEALP